MPRRCYLCYPDQSSNNQAKKTLHQLPIKEQIREQWLKFCGLSENNLTIANFRLCSGHFTIDDYRDPNAKLCGGKLKLKDGVVPSIFKPLVATEIAIKEEVETFSYLPRKELNLIGIKREPIPHNEIPLTSTEKSGELEEGINEDNVMITFKRRKFAEPRYIAEMEIQDFATPQKVSRNLRFAKTIDRKKSRKIKNLANKNRYLLKKIASMKALVKHLCDKGLMSEEAGNTLMAMLPSLNNETK